MTEAEARTYTVNTTQTVTFVWSHVEQLTELVCKDLVDMVDRLQIRLIDHLGPSREGFVDNAGLCKAVRDDLTAMLVERYMYGFDFIDFSPYTHSIGGCPLNYRAQYASRVVPPNADPTTLGMRHIPLPLNTEVRGQFGIVVYWSDRFVRGITRARRQKFLRLRRFRWVAAPRFVQMGLGPRRQLVAYGRPGGLALHRTVELPE